MNKNTGVVIFNLVLIAAFALAACTQATAVPQPTAVPAQPTAAPAQPTAAPKALKIGLVSDQGGVNDKSFNQGAWEGVQKASKEFGFEAQYVESKQPTDYEKNIDQFATEGYGVIVTVGFMMGDATAAKAKQYPNIKFAIVDNAYFPTKGSAACADTVKDCYADGGLTNVTSLMFQEDEVGFLAGVVAAGMSKTGTICTVSGMEIPPVVRYVTGYQAGAKWLKPDIKALNVYIPSFIDPAKGKENGQAMIGQGCDVLFGVGGNTGNGGLLAAKEKGLMAIGVDVDQYNTYPEVKDALVTSAQKNVDAAVYNFLKTVKDGSVKPGVNTANLKNGGVGLAPYHDWDSKVPAEVKAKVQEAIDGLKAGTLSAAGAAVAPAPAGGAKGQVTLWHAYSTGGSEEKALTQILDAYKKANPDVTLNVLQIPFDQVFNKWETEVAAGGGPDMYTAPNDNLGKEVDAGLLLDITDKMQGKTDGVAPVALGGLSVGGKLYGVPGIIKAVALYYNKSTISAPPATTADLLALVKGGKKLVLNQSAYHNFGFFPAYGGAPWNDKGECVNSQPVADAYQFLADLKAADANIFQTDGGKADVLFEQGQADMIINGPWVLGDYKKNLGDKLGVAPMPAGSKPAGPLTGIDGWFVNPNSKNVDAALALALYITNKDGQTIYADVAGDPPIRTDVTTADPLVQAFSDAAAGGYLRPQSTWFNNFWGPFGDDLTKVLEGQMKPADGAVDACTAMNKANKLEVTVPAPK